MVSLFSSFKYNFSELFQILNLSLLQFSIPSTLYNIQYICTAHTTLQVIIEIPYDTMLLYSLALGITVHTSVCEPHLMRKSYTAFLNYLTDHKYVSLYVSALYFSISISLPTFTYTSCSLTLFLYLSFFL